MDVDVDVGRGKREMGKVVEVGAKEASEEWGCCEGFIYLFRECQPQLE